LFKPVDPKVDFPSLDREILEHWKAHDVFRRSIRRREGAPLFRFFEGPPTANGAPHVGHMLPRALKDLFPRYRTMCGYQVPRKAGWDTHGLPVELEVEKDLGISGKNEIEQYGVERFNRQCKESVWRYKSNWETSTERLGYWLDLEDAYITYTNEYIESVWWALRQLWDRGLLYKGHKIVPYCPRCGTSLSSHEVAQGYAQAEDPSVYVRFRLPDFASRLTDSAGGRRDAASGRAPAAGDDTNAPVSLLVWTTTPWTLPSNVAVAVHPDEPYVLVELGPPGGRERLIVAKGCLEEVFGPLEGRAGQAESGPRQPAGDAAPAGQPYRIVGEFPGGRLLGLKYRPPLDFLPEPDPQSGEQAFVVLPGAEFVTLDEGTGIVHMSPAFGEVDYAMGQRFHLPMFQPVDTYGRFTAEVPDWQGLFVKDADPLIEAELRKRGVLFRSGRYRHTYPFCWRCDAPLVYYARESWFIRATAHQERLIELNRRINWLPAHLREGRFGNFLDSLVDWNLSRERYWGAPLPVWICEGCGEVHCVGSYEELRRMAAVPLREPFDPHKPYIDAVLLRCPECGGEMRRVPHVIDCWFESGSMPFAQYHYPFENREVFERMFPADYICEAIDQTRGWFYSLHAIAALIFERPAYMTCLCTEFGVDGEGLKMSKHKGNVIPPEEFLDREGADALRWFLFSGSPPWTVKRFDHATITDVQNQVLDTLWNVYSFFVLYANIDGFDPSGGNAPPPPRERPVLDRWLLSRINGTIAEVRERMDSFDAMGSARVLGVLIDDLSNWYVRRGRRRYWKAEDDADKAAAYWTLYEALVTLARMLAPFIPFVAEAIYLNLAAPRAEGDLALSVHLTDYPLADASLRDEPLEEEMETCRRLVSLGRAARNRAQIRTRQPLSRIVASGASLRPEVETLLTDELNVKAVEYDEEPGRYVSYLVRPNFEAVGPRFGRLTPAIAAALSASDGAEVARLVSAGVDVKLTVAEETVTLHPGEVVVRTEEREGFAVERDGQLQVALSTERSRKLLLEGLSRELVNRVQRMRKDAGFDVSDRVEARIAAAGDLLDAARAYSEHIAREVLAVKLDVDALPASDEAAACAESCSESGAGPRDAGVYCQRLEVEGYPLAVALRRVR